MKKGDFYGFLLLFVSIMSTILGRIGEIRNFIMCCASMWFVVAVMVALYGVYENRHRKSKGKSLLERKLTQIDEDGNYSLPAEDLYEAIEKLGYIEHEQNR